MRWLRKRYIVIIEQGGELVLMSRRSGARFNPWNCLRMPYIAGYPSADTVLFCDMTIKNTLPVVRLGETPIHCPALLMRQDQYGGWWPLEREQVERVALVREHRGWQRQLQILPPCGLVPA